MSADRKEFFKKINCDMQNCATYEQLEEICHGSAESVNTFELPQKYETTIVGERLTGDKMVWTLYQESSVSNFGQRFPVNVVGDGNCLPRTGSLLATGTQEHALEISVRIVCELVLHKDSYLSPAYI